MLLAFTSPARVPRPRRNEVTDLDNFGGCALSTDALTPLMRRLCALLVAINRTLAAGRVRNSLAERLRRILARTIGGG